MSEERKGLLRCGGCVNYDAHSEKCKLWQNKVFAAVLACAAYEPWENRIASLEAKLHEAQSLLKECPVGDLDLAKSLLVEKRHMQDELRELQAILAAKDEALRDASATIETFASMLDEPWQLDTFNAVMKQLGDIRKALSLTPADALKRQEAMERVVEAAKECNGASKRMCEFEVEHLGRILNQQKQRERHEVIEAYGEAWKALDKALAALEEVDKP